MSYRSYRSVRYRYLWRTQVTEVPSTGIDVVPILPKYPVPVLMSYRTYRCVRYRYPCRTDITEVSGTGIDVVPNLPKCPVPVTYRRYASVRTVPNTHLISLLRYQACSAPRTSQHQSTAESSNHTVSTPSHLPLDADGTSLVQTATEIGGRSGLLVCVNIEKHHHQQYSQTLVLYSCSLVRLFVLNITQNT